MGRRRFDHLVLELSLAAGLALPRYPLWLALHERGFDPEALERGDVARAFDVVLPAFLSARGIVLRAREVSRLRRALLRFDPRVPSPEDRLARP